MVSMYERALKAEEGEAMAKAAAAKASPAKKPVKPLVVVAKNCYGIGVKLWDLLKKMVLGEADVIDTDFQRVVLSTMFKWIENIPVESITSVKGDDANATTINSLGARLKMSWFTTGATKLGRALDELTSKLGVATITPAVKRIVLTNLVCASPKTVVDYVQPLLDGVVYRVPAGVIASPDEFKSASELTNAIYHVMSNLEVFFYLTNHQSKAATSRVKALAEFTEFINTFTTYKIGKKPDGVYYGTNFLGRKMKDWEHGVPKALIPTVQVADLVADVVDAMAGAGIGDEDDGLAVKVVGGAGKPQKGKPQKGKTRRLDVSDDEEAEEEPAVAPKAVQGKKKGGAPISLSLAVGGDDVDDDDDDEDDDDDDEEEEDGDEEEEDGDEEEEEEPVAASAGKTKNVVISDEDEEEDGSAEEDE